MTVLNRRRQVIKAGLLLGTVFLVLNAMPKPLYTLKIKVNDTDIRSIEVRVDDRVHASVVFEVVPNVHDFALPEGEHLLSIFRSDGTRGSQLVRLESDRTITL